MREASSRAASDRAGNSRSGFKVGISQTLEGVGVFTVRRCVPLHPHARTEHFPPSFLCQWGSTGGFQDVVILSHIPRIPLGMARVPGEVCSVFILPSVAPNPRLHTGREEKTKTFREREREPHRHPLNRLTHGYLKLSDVLTEASSGRDLEERVFIQGGAGLRWYSSADVDEPLTSDSFSTVALN